MPAVKNVGEPCAGEPHARIDGGREETGQSGQQPRGQAPLAYPTNLPHADRRVMPSRRRGVRFFPAWRRLGG